MNQKKEIIIFNSSDFGEVRTFKKEGKPYFCLVDVCRILEINNPRQAKTRLKEDGVISNDATDSLGRIQSITFINESNLYKLIFQSRKPEAEKFTDWVTNEVLPSIRKHGMYAVDELIDNPDLAIKAFQALKEERDRRIEAERKNAILMHHSKMYTATEIAKEVGLKSANELNKILEEKGIQYKVNGTWVPTADYADLGYFHIKQEVLDNEHETVIYHRKITQDGRAFLVNLLVKKDEPLFEKENTEELFE